MVARIGNETLSSALYVYPLTFAASELPIEFLNVQPELPIEMESPTILELIATRTRLGFQHNSDLKAAFFDTSNELNRLEPQDK